MKLSFHFNPDPGASPGTIAVFDDDTGNPLSQDQTDSVLLLLNNPIVGGLISETVNIIQAKTRERKSP